MAEKGAGAELNLTWLGQAGFIIEFESARIVIDAYLSDSLREKYRGGLFPHERMMDPPINPEEIAGLSFVLCTHSHTDHMDPPTLRALAKANPGCRFICPAAEKQKAVDRGVPADRFIGMDAGDVYDDSGNSGFRFTAFASAHEKLETDDQGRSLFLGYLIEISGLKIYHSGDCVPYEGLADGLKKFHVDAALLPVNGRDEFRTSSGIAGNFTLTEAVELCKSAGIGTIVPHHFGMFDFNTEDPGNIKKELMNSGLEYTIPKSGEVFKIKA